MGEFMGMLSGLLNDEKDELDQLLTLGKQKLIEAGEQLLADAKGELDGLTVTVTITATVSKKS